MNARTLVAQIFRGLLGRDADSEGLQRYSKIVSEPDGVAACLREMIDSQEFAARIRWKNDGASFRTEDLEREKIIFLHIPKTGGSTLHHLLVQGRTDDEVCPERHNGLHAFTAGELATYRIFSGHFDHASTQLIPGRKVLVTMFRNPVDRLVSLYRFQRAHADAVIEQDNLYLALLANRHSMEEFFRLDEVRHHPSINNAMTRALTERLPCVRWEHRVRLENVDQASNVEAAMAVVEGMPAFGILEDLERSVDWMCSQLGIERPQVIPRIMALDAIVLADPRLKPIIREPITETLLDVLQELVEYDSQLYERARRLLSEACG